MLSLTTLALLLCTCSSLVHASTSKDQALAEVETLVARNRVVVFSKTYCPYCRKAKAALSTLLKPDQMTIVELDQRSDGDVLQDALQKITGARSVPRVFIGGNFFGGGDATAAAAGDGTLKQLLIEAGVDVDSDEL